MFVVLELLFLLYAAIAIYLVCGQCKSTKHMHEGGVTTGWAKGNSSKLCTFKWTHVCCLCAICMTNLLFGPNEAHVPDTPSVIIDRSIQDKSILQSLHRGFLPQWHAFD